jgi:hypothetical protein
MKPRGFDPLLDSPIEHGHDYDDVAGVTDELDLRYLKLSGGTVVGSVSLKPSADSASLLRIFEETASNVVFNVDTINRLVGVGGSFIVGYKVNMGESSVSGKAKCIDGMGYLDFGTPSNVTVNRGTGAMSGYAFSDDLGWVAFGVSDGGDVVVNVTTGEITGKAKILSTGEYLYFSSYNANAVVDINTGIISGYAFSLDFGWFDFEDTGVTLSDWSPAVTTTEYRFLVNGVDDVVQAVIKASSIQTENILEVQSSVGGVLFGIDNVGKIITDSGGLVTNLNADRLDNLHYADIMASIVTFEDEVVSYSGDVVYN